MKKKMNEMWFEDNTKVYFFDLPNGYFYKNHFYTESKCFSKLLEDKEVKITNFTNGVWIYKYYWFTSLKELYEWFEEVFAISYSELKRRYNEYEIEHRVKPTTMYSFYEDDGYQLYYSKSECLLEMRNHYLLESETEREERYLDKITDDECRAYLKKSIKERITILEEYSDE